MSSLVGDDIKAIYSYTEDGLRVSKAVNDMETSYEYEDGSLSARYIYDSFGVVLNVVDVNGKSISDQTSIGRMNSIRYRGYYYDQETGLYYLQSRYYDPANGRFINADSVVVLARNKNNMVENNMYTYCYNNPIINCDLDGYITKTKTWKKRFGKGSIFKFTVKITVNLKYIWKIVRGAKIKVETTAYTHFIAVDYTYYSAVLMAGTAALTYMILNVLKIVEWKTIALVTLFSAIVTARLTWRMASKDGSYTERKHNIFSKYIGL